MTTNIWHFHTSDSGPAILETVANKTEAKAAIKRYIKHHEESILEPEITHWVNGTTKVQYKSWMETYWTEAA